MLYYAVEIHPGEFDSDEHYYPKVLNAQLHPLVRYFLNLTNEQIIYRYCHFHPQVEEEKLRELLDFKPKYFRWAGADLFAVTTGRGVRQMVLIETNSCPSGNKSMPYIEEQRRGGYERLLANSFLPTMKKKKNLPDGKLAVIYDKNPMENIGYARTLADLVDDMVYAVEFHYDDPNAPVKFEEGIMYVRNQHNQWIQIKAAFRYVTQKPWTQIPIITKTMIYNPILACLAGGRNKLIAAKAYDFFNADYKDTGLQIRVPETIWDLSKNEIPLWVERMGGFACIKNPYSNAGQGVYTIMNQHELQQFMEKDYPYDKFIVQSLIGNSQWSSNMKLSRLYHIGTVPNLKHEFFAADLRMMVCSSPEGFRPIAMYARRARKHLSNEIADTIDSWEMLGTNLSVRNPDGTWGEPDVNRLLLMDRREFNRLGLGLDDLIESFIQTVMGVIAIDKIARKFISKKGEFKKNLFQSLVPDKKLFDEILISK
ncbi:MAG: hypothetical protein JW776_08190 [Candidatus Lokiarchaeota archaeon]|nr:hypothetical protein [Candidatus Lokiarchaeota archaeon]